MVLFLVPLKFCSCLLSSASVPVVEHRTPIPEFQEHFHYHEYVTIHNKSYWLPPQIHASCHSFLLGEP